MTERPVMIFHTAYRLNPQAGNASGIRPLRMKQAFADIGYEVLEVSGSHAERRDRIKDLKRRIRDGLAVDFVYSESSTAPTGLGEKVTPATSLTRDIAFLRFCQRSGIPAALFYHDIYWRFPIYAESVRFPLRTILRAIYRWDLLRYRIAGLRIYLPSLQMARWVPIIERERVRELPPGGEPRESVAGPRDGVTRLLYVGGLGSNYRLRETIAEISGREDASLTVCVPEAHWESQKSEYLDVMGPNVQVVHRSGDGLDELYANADACLIAVEPIVYWSFAAPVKLFEYISRGKPVVASADTFAGSFVADRGVGWVVRYGSGELPELLDRLASEPELLEEARERVLEIQPENTWEARARTVAEDLRAEAGKR